MLFVLFVHQHSLEVSSALSFPPVLLALGITFVGVSINTPGWIETGHFVL